MYMIAPILALFCAIGTKCKVTAKIAITKRKIHFFFTENKKRVISTNFREKSATPAMVLPGTCPLAGEKKKASLGSEAFEVI
jgi:hypothetical protein